MCQKFKSSRRELIKEMEHLKIVTSYFNFYAGHFTNDDVYIIIFFFYKQFILMRF